MSKEELLSCIGVGLIQLWVHSQTGSFIMEILHNHLPSLV